MRIINIDKNNINLYINYLLVAYAFCIPVSKAGTNIAEVLILLLWVYQGNWKYKLEQYKSNPFILTFGAFIAFSFISLFWASSFSFGLEYIAKYRHFLIIPVMYTSLDKKFVPHIISAFLMAILVSEIMSYGIFFELWKYNGVSPHDPTPFMSHMTYSTILAFTSTILLTKIFLAKKEELKFKILYGVFFISVIANLFINGGRTGQIIFIILIFVLKLIHVKHKAKAIALSISTLFIIFSLAYNFSPNFHNRANTLYNEVNKMIYQNDYSSNDSSLGARVSLWMVGYETFKDNFLFGTGIGNDMNDVKKHAEELGFKPKYLGLFDDNHNMFITNAVQLGIVGLILIILLFYYLFKLKFKEDEYRSINIMFVIAFVMFSFTHNTFHTMHPMTFFALFAGLLNAISNIEHTKLRKNCQ